MERPSHAGLRHLALNVTRLAEMKAALPGLIDQANAATVDLFNPVLPVLPLEVAIPTSRTDRTGEYKILGFYAQDMVSLGEHWKLLAGLRHDRFRQEVHFPAGQQGLARAAR